MGRADSRQTKGQRSSQGLGARNVIPMHFTPDRIGQYEIVCTQLCGLGHHHMHSMLNVVSADDYLGFLKRQAAAQ